MNSSQAIQIIVPENHKFRLHLDGVKRILEADEIKDRNVVVVSVTGVFRKGKSFLLNFFLKYLYAQYKKHDVSDWLGEHGNSAALNGFEFAGGRKPKTTGIWMWSEVFTHDFANGEKVAIILLDTQGIFDSRSTLMDNTTIFTISMMLSSVQCYNVMQNIQEDNLQHLELFTEYGLLALNQSVDKAFQKLLFIVRDWPNAYEMPYGDGNAFINELMTESNDHTNEMKQLRRRIKSSFDKIGAYLMPYPGNAVATGRNTNADLSQIDAEFIENLKKLVPSLFAPENLIVKKIHGQKIRARELVVYLQSYVSIFNEGNLPEPNTVLKATAMTLLLLLSTDCFNVYSKEMEKILADKSLIENEPYFSPLDLKVAHDDARDKALLKFQQRQKLGATELINAYKTKLIQEINVKYQSFVQSNNEKQSAFKAKVLANLRALEMTCIKMYTETLRKAFDAANPISKQVHLNVHQTAKEEALSKFKNERKFGSDEIIETFQTKLENNINVEFMKFDLQNDNARQVIEEMKEKSEEEKAKAIAKVKEEEMQRKLKAAEADMKNLQIIATCLNSYKASMQKFIYSTDTFFNQAELEQTHENAKADALAMFKRDQDSSGGNTNMLLSRLESDLDGNFHQFSYLNDSKRKDIQSAEEAAKMEREIAEMRRELASSGGGGGGECTIL